MPPDHSPTIADSVRLAWPSEAEAIARVQRRVWEAQLPPLLAGEALTALSVAEMAEAWHAAIERPPAAGYRVLVAVEDGQVVGFATTLPGQDEDAVAPRDGEIDQFAIDPPAQRRGHGSRLLNACADTLRADGFTRATVWADGADHVLRGFLGAAGWSPDGASRRIGADDPGGGTLAQIRLHTDLTQD